jgi:hypothetical protein
MVPAGIVGRLRLAWYRLRRRLGLARGEEPRVRGLRGIVPRERLEAAVARFLERCEDNPVRASRELFFDLLGPLRDEAGKPALVEMSTFTIARAPELARMFPEARFVHIVRDGRDSGVSKAHLREKAHHPSDAVSGIDFWADRLALAEAGVRGLAPEDRRRLHLMSLDELVWSDRERAYGELLDFLGVEDEPGMREFFDREMTTEAANRERWREGLDAEEQWEVTAHYEATLTRLARERYHCALLLRRTYELTLASQPIA